MKSYLLVVFTAIVISSCNRDRKPENITALKKGDSTFLALKDTAQKHLQIFIDSLAQHGTDTSYRFVVKSDFVEGEEHEHMWSEIYNYKTSKFLGQFIDSAYVVKNIKPGDAVKIEEKDIEDWTIFNNKDHVVTGNFSDKYLKSKR